MIHYIMTTTRDQEIASLEAECNQRLQYFLRVKNYYVRYFQRRVLPHRVKQYYIRYIQQWYQRQCQQVEQYKQQQLQAIEDKYNRETKKYALLVGINYENTNGELKGCINDVEKLKETLETKFQYHGQHITTLLESQCTRNNILNEFSQLLQKAKAGDKVFFSFSGHGYSYHDYSRDENDGKDELVITIDRKGIFDDEFKRIIMQHLKKDVTLVAIFDNCHSGTILDLPYQYFKNDNESMIHHNKQTETHGTVICLSGCRDDQVSIDARFGEEYNGALSWTFVQLMKQEKSMTWKECVSQLREYLERMRLQQVPQITCGTQMDLAKEVVEL
jgi:hypothetical protein